jgi:hypothetical protein
LGYDIIGRIFERLIPQKERRWLGQYFTSPDVVDLILRFCLFHEDDTILDPSCGAGTFLVRAYQQKRAMNSRKAHKDILATLWGNDIAKFPAHLATINLSINDLAVDQNYPNILQEDFFDLPLEAQGFVLPERYKKRLLTGLGKESQEVTYPRRFDAIVGNPPYTRQEDISRISPGNASYKQELVTKASVDSKSSSMSEISERAGIHAYFFIRGTQFLEDGGHFGFIVADAWLDTEYGRGLQELFLNNYKVIAVIESKVERWFEEADVNTCIIILQKCSNSSQRDENLVRFVYLKKPLRHFIPAAESEWEQQIGRLAEIDTLKRTILAHRGFYENDELRVLPVRQNDLWIEGFDPHSGAYVGAKWGKYLRAPEILFKIIAKSRDALEPLKNVAEVRFGLKSGANEFFYLDEDQIREFGLETDYFRPIIFSLKEVKGYRLDRSTLARKVLICNQKKADLKGKAVLRYIQQGEDKGYNQRPTCAQRSPEPWYSLARGWDPAPLIFPAKVGERMPVFLNEGVFEDKKLYGVTPKADTDPMLLAALLNCTLTRLFIEFTSRQLTGSQTIADIDVTVVEELPIPRLSRLSDQLKKTLIDKFKRLADTDALSIFKEVSPTPEGFHLENVKPERRELDSVVMREILGLSEEEESQVYISLVDFIRSRLEKAKTFGTKTKKKEDIDVEAITMLVAERIKSSSLDLRKFYDREISSRAGLVVQALPERHSDLRIDQNLFGYFLRSGSDEIACNSEERARYLRVFVDAGVREISVPSDDPSIAAILPELERLKAGIDEIIGSYLETILDPRLKDRIRRYVFRRIMQGSEQSSPGNDSGGYAQ